MKQAFLQKKHFILDSKMKVLQMKTTSMLKLFERNLILSQWNDYFKLYNLSDVLLLADIFKTLGILARIIMDWIRLGISVRQVLPGILH